MLTQVIFWLCLLTFAYTYLGYPLVLKFLCASRRPSPAPALDAVPAAPPPSLSIILVARDEARRIAARIANLAACHYPGQRQLIVVCNACSDDTAKIARAWRGSLDILVVEQDDLPAKAAGLNRGVAAASGDLLVFADARQDFDPDALVHLVAPFSNPQVAAVSGNLTIAASASGAAAGIDSYWQLERWIRKLESRWDSSIGCTGAIYALRRECFLPIPHDTILDDVVIPMQALVAGGRVLFEPSALAFDPQVLSPEQERRRKVRTLAGNYQMLFRYPAWLLPSRNRAWWQLASHKYLRLGGPALLFACLASASYLSALPSAPLLYRFALAAQLACYALAALGIALPSLRSRLLTLPAGFLFLQWQALRALRYYLKLRHSSAAGGW